jgi:hypothetical protein
LPEEVHAEVCNPFFDVIFALEHEAKRLDLNLLASFLEMALDACLMERRRLERHAPTFRMPAGQPFHGKPADEALQSVVFRSVRAA